MNSCTEWILLGDIVDMDMDIDVNGFFGMTVNDNAGVTILLHILWDPRSSGRKDDMVDVMTNTNPNDNYVQCLFDVNLCLQQKNLYGESSQNTLNATASRSRPKESQTA